MATLGLGVFLVGWGTNASTPLLVLYKSELGLGNSSTMAIFTVYVVGILATLPLAGPLSDRFGRRAIVLPGVLLSATGSLVLILGRDEFAFLLVGRLILGVVSGAVLGVSAAWLQELMGPGNERRAAVMSTVITYVGFGIGPPISAAFEWLTDAPLVVPFVFHAAVTLIFVPFLMRVPETNTADRRRDSIRIELGVPPEARHTFLGVAVPAAIWVFSFPSTSFALFPVLLGSAIPDADVAVAAASGVLTAWSALLARPILSRFGHDAALLGGMAMGTIGYVFGSIAFATDAWGLVLPAAVLLGAASGTLTAGVLGLLAEMAAPESRGAINSTFYLLAYPGMAMPILLTTIAGVVGLTTSLTLVTSAAALATGASALGLVRRQRAVAQAASSAT
ncbi:MAG: MFS transporter [Acidimicrobiales bacterium]